MRSRVPANFRVHQDPALRRTHFFGLVWLAVALAFTGGCRTIVRELQRSEAREAPEVLAVDGCELVLTTYLWAEAPLDASSGFLRGRLTVSDRHGKPVPRTLRLYHFQLVRPALGSWLVNVRVTGYEAWIAQVKPDIVCEFHIDRRKLPITSYDVVANLADPDGNRYTVKAASQPVHRGPPPPRARL